MGVAPGARWSLLARIFKQFGDTLLSHPGDTGNHGSVNAESEETERRALRVVPALVSSRVERSRQWISGFQAGGTQGQKALPRKKGNAANRIKDSGIRFLVKR